MLKIKGISTDALQELTLILPDLSELVVTIYFTPMQYGWFIRSLSYGDFKLNGLRITNQINMLRQFKNIIPFGLGCFSTNDREPSLQDDFLNENSILYILTQAEVEAYEDYLNA